MTAILLKGSGGSQSTTLELTVSQEVADTLYLGSEVVYNNDRGKLMNAGYLRNCFMPDNPSYRGSDSYRTTFILGKDSRYLVTLTSKDSTNLTASHPLYFRILDTLTGEETDRIIDRTVSSAVHSIRQLSLNPVVYKDEYTVGILQFGFRTGVDFKRGLPLVIQMLGGPETLTVNGRATLNGVTNGSYEITPANPTYFNPKYSRSVFLGNGRFVFSICTNANTDTRGYIESDFMSMSSLSTTITDHSYTATHYPGSLQPIGDDMFLSRNNAGFVVLNKVLDLGTVDVVSTTASAVTSAGNLPNLFYELYPNKYIMATNLGNQHILHSIRYDSIDGSLSKQLLGTVKTSTGSTIKVKDKFLFLSGSVGTSSPVYFGTKDTGVPPGDGDVIQVEEEILTRGYGLALASYNSLVPSYDGCFVATANDPTSDRSSPLSGIATLGTFLNALGRKDNRTDPILGIVTGISGLTVTINTLGYGSVSESELREANTVVYPIGSDYMFSPKDPIKSVYAVLGKNTKGLTANTTVLNSLQLAINSELFLVLDKNATLRAVPNNSASLFVCFGADGMVLHYETSLNMASGNDIFSILNIKANYTIAVTAKAPATNTAQATLSVTEGEI
ncbi:hypothetical protein [Pseudoalteromonas phage vB_PtuP_Slicky01]|nr:hypothetical protein [Pseudoalteromonas phage vB_PtuP_Slicky01]